jgi:hypothetical protein
VTECNIAAGVLALLSRDELTATLFAIADIRQDVRGISIWLRGVATMGKPPKMTRKELEERLEREREFRELLERRVEVDRRLAAEREQRSK